MVASDREHVVPLYFGSIVESVLDWWNYLLLYLAAGLLSSFGSGLIVWAVWHLKSAQAITPGLGASGAIAGVIGSYLALHPKARIRVPIPIGPFLIPLRKQPGWVGWIFAALWGGNETYTALIGNGLAGGVNHLAHVAGFAAGILLIVMDESAQTIFIALYVLAMGAVAAGISDQPLGHVAGLTPLSVLLLENRIHSLPLPREGRFSSADVIGRSYRSPSPSGSSARRRRNCGSDWLRQRPAQTEGGFVGKLRLVPALGMRVIAFFGVRPGSFCHPFQRHDAHSLLLRLLQNLRAEIALRIGDKVQWKQNGVGVIAIRSRKGRLRPIGC